jgi:hypothetical protein
MFNRVVLACVVVAVIVLIIYGVRVASEPRHSDVMLPETEATDRLPRAVRLGRPLPIMGTATMLVPIEYGSAQTQSTAYSSSYYAREPMVNAMFLRGNQASLLLDRPARIASALLPDTVGPAREWIAYDLAFEDTNGDGRLNDEDGRTLALSSVHGSDFRVVLPAGAFMGSFHVLDSNRIVVFTFSEPPPKRGEPDPRRQSAYVYDVAAGTLQPLDAANALVEQASTILAN